MKKDKFLVLRNFTVEPIFSEVEEKLINKKIKPIFEISGYENAYLSLLNSKKKLDEYKGCILILSIDSFFQGKKRINTKIIKQEIKNQYENIIDILIKKKIKNIFVFYFSKSLFYNINLLQLNKKLEDISKKYRNIKIIELCKELNWYEEIASILSKRSWTQSMFPFNGLGLKTISLIIYRNLLNIYHSKIKLILLDADNTLWNGVIDEVGYKRINLKNNLINYRKFQKNLLELKKDGMMLGIVSKNDYKNIEKAFVQNKHKMALRLKDFSAISANWEPKYKNILNIVKKLNISVDQTLYIDDSEFEIESVKKMINRLESIKINEYKNFTDNLNLIFKNLEKVTLEDKKRFKLYQLEEKRVNEKRNSQDFKEYVSNLNIELNIKKNNIKNISRLSQLTQRTNQFNSTTLRFNEKQIKEIIKNKKIDIIECHAKDKFGAYGTIGSIIIDKSKKDLNIINFLMSCRALGRDIEIFFLDYVYKKFCSNKSKIFLHYQKSEKNKLFYNFANKYFRKSTHKNEFILYMIDKPIIKQDKNFIKIIDAK